ncbi:methyltransferase family protein [Kushneria sinocarnis]|uniref:Methyltransferase family protein n=1 Tax=Kushneria sinocarnis TaxID=595502 RepID=A0A420WSX5_9GAMM|nr:class I SAM-dependent methyltransferase [Kushneria sinocarnis]RKQ95832.1 methyltransferase family protein [Kushneria sinocarnis]
MSDWSGGYVTDVLYTPGYYSPLNPLIMQLALTRAGVVAPTVGTACELGIGRGVSLNAHATASVTRWYGNDFIPAQLGFARSLAEQARSDARLFEEDFATFCARTDLPDFDFIALHGVWSWIDERNREVLVDFLRRRLRTGGVVYISYNTTPGWATFAPMREILREHGEVMSAPGQGTEARVREALGFAERLLAVQPGYAEVNPEVHDRLGMLQQQDSGYLAHEYFNRDWHPMPFSRVAEQLRPARLEFACSAHLPDHFDAINLTPAHRQLLGEIGEKHFRQTVRDFLVNQSFRRDHWVRGARELSSSERLEALRRIRVVLISPRQEIPLTVRGSLGEATMSEAIYAPVLEALADYRPHTLGELEHTLAGRVRQEQLEYAVVLLAGAGHLCPAQAPDTIEQALPGCRRLNATLLQRARSHHDTPWLASPVTGGAVMVPRFDQLFLLARERGERDPRQWAALAWQILEARQQRVVREGAPLEDEADNLAELHRQACHFEAVRLPVLQALQVA